jgi:hypothetical protein
MIHLQLLGWGQMVVALADCGGFSGVALDGGFGAGRPIQGFIFLVYPSSSMIAASYSSSG